MIGWESIVGMGIGFCGGLLHMVCVCVEYRRRRRRGFSAEDVGWSRSGGTTGPPQEAQEAGEYEGGEERTSIAKHLESADTMFSFIWWIIGFYWVSAGGQTLTRYAPQSTMKILNFLYNTNLIGSEKWELVVKGKIHNPSI